MKNYLPELKRNHETPLIGIQSSWSQNNSLFCRIKKLTLFSILFVIFSLLTVLSFAQTNDTLTIGTEQGSIIDPDHLGGPIYVGEVPPLVLPGASSTKSAQINNLGLKSAMTSDPIWPNPGAVHIEKTAEATDVACRWKINLTVEGKNIQSTSDVVLVIDDSGSMSGTKMSSAKDAAKKFVDSLLIGSTGIRIAIVTINGGSSTGTPEIDKNFTNNRTQLKNAIDAITASGGTNLQGGFYMARLLLNSSTANHKSTVLLSDGYPTYNYASNIINTGATPYVTSCSQNWWWGWSANWSRTRDAVEDDLVVTSSIYTNVVGSGSSFDYTLYSVTDDCQGHTFTFNAGNHGIPTEYEAGLLIAGGVDVYTIGFEVPAGGDAEEVLQGSQNKGYYPATSSNIDDIYDDIRSSIAYAASNAVLTDPMSDYVVLEASGTPSYSVEPDHSGDVVVTKGTVNFVNLGAVPGTSDTKWKIIWNIGTVNENPGDAMWYYINMASTTDPTLLYDANDQTFMDYIDVNNASARQQTNEDFTIPKCGCGKGSIEVFYFLVNANGDPINSSGTVVSVPEFAYRIPQNGSASSYFEYAGSTVLDIGPTYSVSGETPYSSSDGSDYTIHSNYAAAQSITPTSAEPNKQAWFGYTEVVCTETVTAGSNSPVCERDDIDMTATAISGGTYSWTGPVGFISTVQNPTRNNAQTSYSGEYIVTVSYGSGCEAKDTVSVNITPSTSGESSETACDSYTWDGTTYTT